MGNITTTLMNPVPNYTPNSISPYFIYDNSLPSCPVSNLESCQYVCTVLNSSIGPNTCEAVRLTASDPAYTQNVACAIYNSSGTGSIDIKPYTDSGYSTMYSLSNPYLSTAPTSATSVISFVPVAPVIPVAPAITPLSSTGPQNCSDAIALDIYITNTNNQITTYNANMQTYVANNNQNCGTIYTDTQKMINTQATGPYGTNISATVQAKNPDISYSNITGSWVTVGGAAPSNCDTVPATTECCYNAGPVNKLCCAYGYGDPCNNGGGCLGSTDSCGGYSQNNGILNSNLYTNWSSSQLANALTEYNNCMMVQPPALQYLPTITVDCCQSNNFTGIDATSIQFNNITNTCSVNYQTPQTSSTSQIPQIPQTSPAPQIPQTSPAPQTPQTSPTPQTSQISPAPQIPQTSPAPTNPNGANGINSSNTTSSNTSSNTSSTNSSNTSSTNNSIFGYGQYNQIYDSLIWVSIFLGLVFVITILVKIFSPQPVIYRADPITNFGRRRKK